MNKHKFLTLCTVIFVVISVIVCIHSISVMGTNSFYDFEDKSFKWSPLYGNSNYEFITEDNNTYLKLSYNGEANRDREYFDVQFGRFDSSDKNIQIDYDIMYSDFTDDRNGEIQLKNRTGPGTNESTILARVAQIGGYLQVQGSSEGFKRIKSLNGEYLSLETNHWYRISVTVDIENSIQNVYVFDRDTESLLGLYQDMTTTNEMDYINMVTFSSGTSMCLDNVKIMEQTCENTYIYGSPYAKRDNKQRYYFIGKNIMNNNTSLPYGTTVWSIENPRNGVSINSVSGNLNVSSTAEPGTVIIKATRTVGDMTYESKYPVNII